MDDMFNEMTYLLRGHKYMIRYDKYNVIYSDCSKEIYTILNDINYTAFKECEDPSIIISCEDRLGFVYIRNCGIHNKNRPAITYIDKANNIIESKYIINGIELSADEFSKNNRAVKLDKYLK